MKKKQKAKSLLESGHLNPDFYGNHILYKNLKWNVAWNSKVLIVDIISY